jgi:predicted  nucleic acid-binding Zn-ribbon protein
LREHLELLWELQKIDLDLKTIEEDRDRYPKEIKKLDEKQKFEKERIHKEREKLESLEKERRQKEKNLVGEQDKIKRSEGRMAEIKTNKEYQALLTEIETFKEAVGRAEEEILLVMDEIEEVKKQLSRREKEISVTLERVEAEKREFQERMSQGEVLWKEKLERKERLSKQVESNLFKLYNMLREKRQGIGMVNVRHETCQGCYVNVPPQLFIEVQKNNSLIRCPNCNRILYWDGNGDKK